MRRLQSSLLSSKYKRYLYDDNDYWVDPNEIVYLSSDGLEFNIHEYKGRVIGGNWDRLERKFNEIDFYVSYEKRAMEGSDWAELPYYQRVLSEIETGVQKWGCKNRRDLDLRCLALDELFKDIKKNGYMSQSRLGRERGQDRLLHYEDEIAVNIGRHGDLLFNNGRHRLTFAKLCGVEKVPVKITVRHAEWEAFKREIELYAEKHNGRVYAPLTHIDLQRIPSHYGDERFNIIKGNMRKGSNTLLDIGAHWGYFCNRFECEGLQCTAVENEEESLFFLQRLKRAENRRFAVIPKSILALDSKMPLKYDIVLALAVFHHFLKMENSFRRFKCFLESLDVKEMFFEPHLFREPQMKNAFVNFNPEEFIDFITSNSCLKNYRLIGKCEDERPIYRLWK